MTVDKVIAEFFEKSKPGIASVIAWLNGFPDKVNERMVDEFLADVLDRGYKELCDDVLFALEHQRKDGGEE